MTLVDIITQELGVLAHALMGDHPEVIVFSVCDKGEIQKENSFLYLSAREAVDVFQLN